MNTAKTFQEYDHELKLCREIFQKKTQDYGASWRVLRIPSLIDQIFIKAQRIRSIEDKKEQKVSDPVSGEFMGIVNYCIITLIQIELGTSLSDDVEPARLIHLYDQKAREARELMEAKNHDYGEAWREMWMGSFTDLILSKLLRVRQIMSNDGKTVASEGIEANLYDMINYALFALIRLGGQ